MVIEAFNENGICAICRKKPVERWCDYVTEYTNNITFFRNHKDFAKANQWGSDYQTCDLPMCIDCASEISLNRHFCTHHYKLHQLAELPNKYQKRRQAAEQRKIQRQQFENGMSKQAMNLVRDY